MTKRHRQPSRAVSATGNGNRSPICGCELCEWLRLPDRQLNDLLMQHARAIDDLPQFDRESEFTGTMRKQA